MVNIVGHLCERCNKEVSMEDLQLRYVAVDKKFLLICKRCRDTLITYSPTQWTGAEADGEIGAVVPTSISTPN